MILLIIISILIYIATVAVGGLSLWTIVAFFTTLTFVGRSQGIRVKATKLIPVECLILFLCFTASILLKTFNIITYIELIILRAAFFGIVYYDDTEYIYVSIEREKEIE